MEDKPLKNRDINWLYFNERVLLEASDPKTPLLERLKFLAIFSSNLDEYFKVRISQLRQLKSVDKSLRKKLILKPNKKLKFILKTVAKQQQQFGSIIQNTFEALQEHDIYLRKRNEINADQAAYLKDLFKKSFLKDCTVLKDKSPESLKDGALYLVVQFSESAFDIATIPSDKHPRFVEIPGKGRQYLYLDDIIKMNLEHLFPNKEIQGSYAIKMSRDAELYLEDDYENTELVEIIYESLGKRKSGQPTRFLYDMNMPESLIALIKEQLGLGDVDMVMGGEYHNLSDFFDFPNPFEDNSVSYQSKPPLPHPALSFSKDIFQSISEKDQLVHFPYQQFDVVEEFIKCSALDEHVSCIKMSLYRIARTSVLTDALLKALDNGKEVILFIEAQARFDEENNIKWGRIFEEKGATVFFSVPHIKVHSKIAMIERNEPEGLKRYAYIGTGNFNAKTSKIYCDHGLFTAHKKITADLAQVFMVLERKLIIPKLKHLLVSPFTTRSTFLDLIAKEIANAQAGKKAKITLKMNSLEDTRMILELYRASEAGVEIRLLVRGFCCLVPKAPEDLTANEKTIKITSIVDRYLEHGRIYLFENGGDEKMYIGSADWMTRNLDKRVEVLVPILDTDIFKELKDILQIQLSDNVKARILDKNDTNQRVPQENGAPIIRSQYAIYEYLKRKLNEKS
ncbi:polyphosphate kinase 1 [Flagellimonas sp. HMM57]|uniref:polyphosphate kinase 1 n=1 Tax=unclassified Flagellimonas TaxID=2644544 RepID=UPI0013D3E275|nr:MULTISPECIES: polyphosphate kinase 1 [unclassified Flagellimonas]UII75776.1 polyphosphate kinase 1 [Flagellimonas sp. HMM57]